MTNQHTPRAEEAQLDENQIIALRREKLNAIRAEGIAFPNDFSRNAFAGDLQAQYGALEKADLDPQEIPVKVAGRMMLKRAMGKASFATLQDVSGQIQLYINNQGVGEEAHDSFKHWDMGDILGAEGTLFKTNHGELTVRVSKLHLLSKSLRPLPDKFHGLADQEQKYRQRYVDLITNQDARHTFIKRSQIIQTVRNYMVNERYLEVETPMMHSIPGGATAKPFATHHNALDMPLYLRIAPELYLKRRVVGGLERVFEINRSFRNEGMSTRHNPEFTMLEWYRVGWDHLRLIEETAELVRAALSLLGRDASLRVIRYRDLYRGGLGLDPLTASDGELRAALGDIVIDPAGLTRDDWLDLLLTHRLQRPFQPYLYTYPYRPIIEKKRYDCLP